MLNEIEVEIMKLKKRTVTIDDNNNKVTTEEKESDYDRQERGSS